jgi:hypothetical protein
MSFDIHDHASTGLRIGMKGKAAMDKHQKPFAVYLVSESTDPVVDLTTWFWDNKAEKDALVGPDNRLAGQAFNSAVHSLRHHCGAAGFYPSFPNIRSGNGEIRWETKREVKEREAAQREEKDARTNEAVARIAERDKAAKLAEMQALGPDDIAAKIATIVSAWSNGQHGSIVDAMASAMFAISEDGGFTASWLASAIADKVDEQPDVVVDQTHVKAAA